VFVDFFFCSRLDRDLQRSGISRVIARHTSSLACSHAHLQRLFVTTSRICPIGHSAPLSFSPIFVRTRYQRQVHLISATHAFCVVLFHSGLFRATINTFQVGQFALLLVSADALLSVGCHSQATSAFMQLLSGPEQLHASATC
jgi:hypothetical protein